MKVLVILDNGGYRFYLRSTVWTSDRDRATRFADAASAKAGLEKARKFIQPTLFRKADMLEVSE